MPSLLFVCTGNICRSPFAERYAALLAERADAVGWTFSSAGTGAVVGHPVEPSMAEELRDRGARDDGFAARQLDHAIVSSADWVVTLEDAHRRWVLHEFSDRIRSTVTLGRLAATLPTLEPGLRGEDALAQVAATRLPADPAHDVPDPYRMGRAAYATSAARLARHLDAIAERLF